MLHGITVEKTVKALLQPAIFLLFYMKSCIIKISVIINKNTFISIN